MVIEIFLVRGTHTAVSRSDKLRGLDIFRVSGEVSVSVQSNGVC